MKLRTAKFAIAAALIAICTAPANALCLARDLTRPGGWDGDRSGDRRTFSIDDEFSRSFIVATIKVLSARELHETVDDPEGVTAHTYRVQVVSQFKGPAVTEFTLYNQNSSARFDMELGKTYLAFVLNSQGRSVIDSCGWSDELDQATAALRQVKRLALATRSNAGE